jgi:hypothetical protein
MLAFFQDIRFRDKFIVLGFLITVAAFVLSDPDLGIITSLPGGTLLISITLVLAKCFPFILMLHISRKALLDYVEFDELYFKAKQEPCGAGLMAIAVALVFISISLVIHAAVNS